ncbi:anthranilate phosphoribosyltransferase [Halorussus pelagicus]|uniref:anthranilate phosphoribosyltransferase n=1 Tax=Halorussus pelagicus TaxID=2505977 RepID=UPI001FB5B291|nr:anthranilate phosphoribosyltransferase [Halorussus pelagicus]
MSGERVRDGAVGADDAPEIDGEWPLRRLLTEGGIGSGPKTADDMSYEQSREAFDRVLVGNPDPATLGAFLLANRWKESTPEELAGFADSMRERSVVSATPDADPVDCGGNYDGKQKTAVLGVASGLVAAAAGTPVVAHSGPSLPAKHGTTYGDVLAALGVPTDLDPADSAAMTDEVGFGFYAQSRFNPLVHDLRETRESVGVRTSINTVETLANPANAPVHFGSFYHLSYAERIAGTVRESTELPFERVVMAQGMEGYDDVRPGTTRVAEWAAESGTEGGRIEDDEVETANFGVEFERDDLRVEDLPADSARVTEAVLSGERDGPFADAVALNAGFRIYAGGGAESVGAGVERARDALADGSAAKRLDALRAFEP